MRIFPGLVLALSTGMLVSAEFPAADLEFFEKRVRPLLAEYCYKCHSAKSKKLKGKLRLDYREGAIKGGETGPAVVPGKPEESLLVESIRYQNEDLEMPPKKRLSAAQVADLTEWVKRGAPWPKEAVAEAGEKEKFDLAKRKAEHWAWHPVTKETPPKVKKTGWPVSSVDNFILARLEAAGLKPAGPADKRTLIRRAYYDLIGL
ncbi:MAG: c-type cytochrome domain-containing protein, partial [Verrucomicrobiota bacterium]|nr:c-type cytochrome domain-containing protein [Verrucomicrobiota bacterium]